MKNILLLLFSFTLFLACKKGKADFTITGLITNTSLSTGLNGATVKLYEKPAGTEELVLIGTTSTDLSGVYTFTIPRNQAESYTLTCEKSNHFSFEDEINFSDLSIEDDNVYNYSTTAKAWVKLRFINGTPSGSDILNYTKMEGKSGCQECCEDDQTSITNVNDTSIYCINDGNFSYSYSYLHVGTSNFGEKSAVTIPYDTTEIVLNY